MRASTIPRVIGCAGALACCFVVLLLLGAVEGVLAMGALLFDPSSAGRMGNWAYPCYQWLEAHLLPRAH